MAKYQDVLEAKSYGVDRAPLSAQPATQFDSPQPEGTVKPSTGGIAIRKHDKQPGLRASVRRLSRKVRGKIQPGPHDESSITTNQRAFDKIVLAPTLAPNPPSTTQEDRFDHHRPAVPSLPPLKELIHSPVSTIKAVVHIQGGGNFAENAATKDVTHEAGVLLVRADEEMADTSTESEADLAQYNLELLKKARQDSYVRWTLDRHVNKVIRIRNHSTTPKSRDDFSRPDKNGTKKTDWKSYGNHVRPLLIPVIDPDTRPCIYSTDCPYFQLGLFYLTKYGSQYIGPSEDLPEPTEAALVSSFERILLTATPIQNLYMTSRRISRWESPWESGAYMALYFFFLIYSYITRAFLLLALYLVIRRKYFPPTIAELRTDLEQAEDQDIQAQDISQLIDQHGPRGWVDPLIAEAGPTALSHLEDLANLMEVLRNFYEWRSPTRTASTLSLLIALWILITITPETLLVKLSFFAIGIMFFVLSPIAARYPQYRLLLDPLTWTFWGIPTHADWAMSRLQMEGTQQIDNMRAVATSAQKSQPFDLPLSEPSNATTEEQPNAPIRIGRYHCLSANRHGNLIITTSCINFEMHLTGNEKWSIKYNDLRSMEKAVGSSTFSAGNDIVFTLLDGKEYRACGLKVRDEVFSQIIGYADVGWRRMG